MRISVWSSDVCSSDLCQRMCRVESSLIDGAPITKKDKPTGERDIRRCCALGPFSGHFLSFICGRADSPKSLAVLKSRTRDRKSTRLNSRHESATRKPFSHSQKQNQKKYRYIV